VLEVNDASSPEPVTRTLAGDRDVSFSSTLVREAIAAGRPVATVSDLLAREGTSDSMMLTGVRSALAAPIYQRDEVRYCLYITHQQVGGLFGEEEERLAGFVTTLAGAALENAQNYNELEIAFEALAQAHRDLKTTQGQLIQAGKMAALGQLGAGIAHELNQPIQSIQGFAQRIRRHTEESIAEHADELEIIIKATYRMASIVQNIRLFARDSSFSLEPIEPICSVRDALTLLHRHLEDREIEVSWDAAEGSVPLVMGDQIKLQQVFLNLLQNASDALASASDGGRPKEIVIGWRCVEDRVVITIQDNGPGVAPEHESRLFDPFFTTKKAGHGTGLGLSISYGIIKEHRGELRYEPAPVRGARFSVALPCVGESPS
jgi:C4-dicarboxylate-specific signal transduction histidine kinase